MQALLKWEQEHARRQLAPQQSLVDFASNDYLGLARNIFEVPESLPAGAGGSRLLTGNFPVHEELETWCAEYFQAESALLFPSGYMANLGILSTLPNRGDTILLDDGCHASLKDGMRLSLARGEKFRHNDVEDLERRIRKASGNVFVVTEGLFSMDGDLAPISDLVAICRQTGAYLIVDEAHSTGIMGPEGRGACAAAGCTDDVWMRVHTFGKAAGRTGAVVVGSRPVREYLINRCRTFIYTTAPGPREVYTLFQALKGMRAADAERQHLAKMQALFQASVPGMEALSSPIIPWLIPGNEKVKAAARQLQAAGLDVRPILSPTVPAGTERLRLVLHAFNSENEVNRLISFLLQMV